MKTIAHISTDFGSKFGIPRQSGLVEGLRGAIVFTPEYRNAEALRGLEDFSHIWLLWDFSLAHRYESWSPTVRPPRLGGNKRIGVWATRSPFRPNSIGLSSVRITDIRTHTDVGPVIEVEGADLMDGTPIYDIKPYLTFTDCHPEAKDGFAGEMYKAECPLEVEMPDDARHLLTPLQEKCLRGVIASDPRPQYQHDPGRIYTMAFAGHEVKFRIEGRKARVVSFALTSSSKR